MYQKVEIKLGKNTRKHKEHCQKRTNFLLIVRCYDFYNNDQITFSLNVYRLDRQHRYGHIEGCFATFLLFQYNQEKRWSNFTSNQTHYCFAHTAPTQTYMSPWPQTAHKPRVVRFCSHYPNPSAPSFLLTYRAQRERSNTWLQDLTTQGLPEVCNHGNT